jgi:hypothetical protein
MDHTAAGSAFKETCSLLFEKHIPFEVVFPGDKLADDETLLLPGVVMLSDEEAGYYRNLNCRVIAVTDAGIYNEHGAERCTPAIPAGSLDDLESPFEVSAPAILLEYALTQEGEKLVHLINCCNSEDVKELTVQLPFEAKAVEAFSYEEGVTARMTAPSSVAINSFRTLCTLKFKE